MNFTSLSDIIQLIFAGIILLLCIAWIIRKILRKKSDGGQCNCGCQDCSLSKNCNSSKKKRM